MKKLITLLLALAMVFSLCACGGGNDTPATAEPQNGNSAPATAEPQAEDNTGALEETSENVDADVIPFDEPITVFEDDTAKIELLNFYEEYVDWGDREPAYEKILTFKYYNKTDHEIWVELFQAYIGDDAILIISHDGDESISAGKTSRMRYIIQQYSETTTIALNALEDLYQLNGVFLIQNVNDEGAYEVSFSFPDLF